MGRKNKKRDRSRRRNAEYYSRKKTRAGCKDILGPIDRDYADEKNVSASLCNTSASGCTTTQSNTTSYTDKPATSARPRPYRIPCRGDVWFAELGQHPGTSIQCGCRPVVVISNNTGNRNADTVVVLPTTTQIKRTDLPSHVRISQEDLSFIDANRPMGQSMVLAEQITTIAKSSLVSYLGRIEPGEKLSEIETAVVAELGM